MNQKVVISGAGVISPNGLSIKEFWQNIISGKATNRTLQEYTQAGYGTVQGCVINNFCLTDFLKPGQNNISRKYYQRIMEFDKSIQFALAASKSAILDSGISYNSENNEIGVFIGNAEEGIQSLERITKLTIQKSFEKTFNHFNSLLGPSGIFKIKKEFKQYSNLFAEENLDEFITLLLEKLGNIESLTPPNVLNNKSYALPAAISAAFNLHGPSITINTACASGLDAIGQAYLAIKSGLINYAIAGGSEAPITLQTISALSNLGVLSKTHPKPFCKGRDGFAISEGSGIVLLETLESASKRGAKIYAEIKGYSQSIDGNDHICKIHKEGTYLKKAILNSLKDVDKDKIDYINVHGTGTQDCEIVETRVIKDIFKEHAYKLNLSATKSMTGHSIGAIGGIETIITALAVKNSIIPPTINLDNSDSECDLNNTPISSVKKDIKNALVMSMGFGGYNSALVLGDIK